MLGWYFFITYVSSHIVTTIWLVRRRNTQRVKMLENIQIQLSNMMVDDLDFPMWVNDACDDIDSKFNNIIARLNHPTYKEL